MTENNFPNQMPPQQIPGQPDNAGQNQPPQGQAGGYPQGQPGAYPQGQPAGYPQGQPGGYLQGQHYASQQTQNYAYNQAVPGYQQGWNPAYGNVPVQQYGYGTQTPNQPGNMPPKKRHTGLKIFITIFVILVLAVGGILIYLNVSGTDEYSAIDRTITETKLPNPLPFTEQFVVSYDSDYAFYPKDGNFYTISPNGAEKIDMKTTDYEAKSNKEVSSIASMQGKYALVIQQNLENHVMDVSINYSVYLFDLEAKIQVKTPTLQKNLAVAYLADKKYFVQVNQTGQVEVYNLENESSVASFDSGYSAKKPGMDTPASVETKNIFAVINDHIFANDKNRGVLAVDLKTGKKEKINEEDSLFWVMVIDNGYIVVYNKLTSDSDEKYTYSVLDKDLKSVGSVQAKALFIVANQGKVKPEDELKKLQEIASKAKRDSVITKYIEDSDGSMIDIKDYMSKEFGVKCDSALFTNPDETQFICENGGKKTFYNKGSKEPFLSLGSESTKSSLIFGGRKIIYIEYDKDETGLTAYYLR